MGAKVGKFALTKKEVQEFVKSTHFDALEVEALYEHFKGISATEADDGVIDRKEFQRALAMKESLYLERFFQLFDDNSDGFINFEEFITGLSILCSRGTQDEKSLFSFKMYDFDGDGRISHDEMRKMLLACSLENDLDLSDAHVEILVDKTFKVADRNGDGFIDLAEFRLLVSSNPSMMTSMTVNVSQRIREEKKRLESLAAEAAAPK